MCQTSGHRLGAQRTEFLGKIRHQVNLISVTSIKSLYSSSGFLRNENSNLPTLNRLLPQIRVSLSQDTSFPSQIMHLPHPAQEALVLCAKLV
jgi:hypothetical protein